MKLLLVGCEYAGTTTLATAIREWFAETTGTRIRLIHDHFKIPHTVGHPSVLTEEEQRQLLALSPRIKEVIQRHNLYYHTQAFESDEPDRLVIGMHIEDAVYGPYYFGYGGADEEGDRRVISAHLETRIMTLAPETVLILVKASPEVTADRMRRVPHPNGVLQEEDIPYILSRFEEEYATSKIRHRFVLDTSSVSVDETMTEFVREIEPHLTKEDRVRMLIALNSP